MESVSVPAEQLGLLIGRAGSTIRKLSQSTGCHIDVPHAKSQGEEAGDVKVQLVGGTEARARAASVISNILKTGDAADTLATIEGAMVVSHSLPSSDHISWAGWRLTGVEEDHGVCTEIGNQAVRIWARTGVMRKQAIERVRLATESVLREAELLEQNIVAARSELNPDQVAWDRSIQPFVEQWGVLVKSVKEEGRQLITLLGPQSATRDATALVEARYVKGKATSSVLFAYGQLDAMSTEMANDFSNDLKALQEELQVKIVQGAVALRIASREADAVRRAHSTLRDMLRFYVPDGFALVEGLKPSALMQLRQDMRLRLLRMRLDCVVALDDVEGSAWFCGSGRDAAQRHVDTVLKDFSGNHWEMELEDFSHAYWLLGPSGTGAYLGRLQSESGAKIKVCPNKWMVWVDGKPENVKTAKDMILDSLERLKAKRREAPGNDGSQEPPTSRIRSSENNADNKRSQKHLLFDEREPTIRNMWKVLDPQNTGATDASQLQFIRKATGFQFETRKFFKGLDARGRGCIRHAEFVEMMMSHLPTPEQLPEIIMDEEEEEDNEAVHEGSASTGVT
eukprot:gnl/MRDRNA2_/MRDRNA2_71920_c0_seq1.p1 gnl/MRDRNA2_/MRDRNA2_71920_c0~~gnl/MRDRNA2_/MRDRNA2_71920_c0_seq1.p1  ORF type:complete len:568 (+),score=121.35 gnl/MRDRNA2_/MRDRNA2_71920_c0_seq1:100-1803(+)